MSSGIEAALANDMASTMEMIEHRAKAFLIFDF